MLSRSHKVLQRIAGRSFSGLSVKNMQLGSAAPTGKLGANDIHIKMIASPIHASDVISGSDGIEGVGVVESVGSKVVALSPGNWVLPPLGTKTWCSELVASESTVTRVPNDIPAAYVASTTVELSTAYRVLRDFQKLSEGDFLIQSNANSSMGMAVIQMANAMGVKTINVIAEETPDADNTLRLLTNLGGDINVVASQLSDYGFKDITEGISCKLGLSNVGGKVNADIVRTLSSGSSFVTYDMDASKLQLPTEVVSAKKIAMSPFSIADWYPKNSTVARSIMNAEIFDMVRSGALKGLYEEHDLDDFSYALCRSKDPSTSRKIILRMNFPDRLTEHDAKPGAEYEVFQASYS